MEIGKPQREIVSDPIRSPVPPEVVPDIERDLPERPSKPIEQPAEVPAGVNGLTPTYIVYDEACQIPEEVWAQLDK